MNLRMKIYIKKIGGLKKLDGLCIYIVTGYSLIIIKKF